MASIDLFVLAGGATATLASAIHFRRRGARGRRYALALAGSFHGIVLMLTMLAHTGDVLSRLWLGTGYGGAPFPWDFRAYGLLLLGAVLATNGAVLFRAARATAAGEEGSVRGATLATLLSLAVVVPLLPIHAVFAVGLTGIGALHLATLGALGRRKAVFLPAPGAAAALALAVVALAGCAAGSTVETPGETPYVTGPIERLDHRATASGILVRAGSGDGCGIVATADAETRHLQRTGSGALRPSTVASLAVGDTVKIYVDGPIMKSCPAQGRASAVVRLSAER